MYGVLVRTEEIFSSFYGRAENLKSDVCGTNDFLGEPENFMCTYDILFPNLVKVFILVRIIFVVVEKVQKRYAV